MSDSSSENDVRFDWDPREGPWTGPVGKSKTAKGKIVYWAAWWAYAILGFFLFRHKAKNQHHLLKEGPFLIVGNHVSMFDPNWVAYRANRKDVHFMASASLFSIPILGPFIRSVGAFPKAKFSKDKGAMKHMINILKNGGIVVLFPEGRRTWDGRTVKPLPGTGRFLQRTRVPLVPARNLTGHLFQPRWAVYPRWIPIRIEYGEPVVFDEDMTPDEINEAVYNAIKIDPDKTEIPGFSFGFRMAHGLAEYLWACPDCLTEEGLKLHPKNGNALRCHSCEKSWKVDIACYFHPMGHEGESHKVSDIVTFLETSIVPSERAQEMDSGADLLLTCQKTRIRKIPKRGGTPTLVAEGSARLTTEALEILNPEGEITWSLPLESIVAASLDLANRFFLRTAEDYLELVPEGQNRTKWLHYMLPYLYTSKTDPK